MTPSFFERASAAEVEAEATLSVEETLPAEGPVTAQKRRLRKRTCISARARVALSSPRAPTPHRPCTAELLRRSRGNTSPRRQQEGSPPLRLSAKDPVNSAFRDRGAAPAAHAVCCTAAKAVCCAAANAPTPRAADAPPWCEGAGGTPHLPTAAAHAALPAGACAAGCPACPSRRPPRLGRC